MSCILCSTADIFKIAKIVIFSINHRFDVTHNDISEFHAQEKLDPHYHRRKFTYESIAPYIRLAHAKRSLGWVHPLVSWAFHLWKVGEAVKNGKGDSLEKDRPDNWLCGTSVLLSHCYLWYRQNLCKTLNCFASGWSPAALDGLNLVDFIQVCWSLKGYEGRPLMADWFVQICWEGKKLKELTILCKEGHRRGKLKQSLY